MSASTASLLPTKMAPLAVALALLTSCHMNPEVEQPQLPASTQANSGSWNGSNTSNNTNQGWSQGNQANTGGESQGRAAAAPTTEAFDVVNPLRVGFMASYDEGDSGDSFEVDLDVGYRIGGYFEIGGLLGLADEDPEDILDPSVYRVGPSARIYFVDRGQIQPWVAGAIGIGNYQLDDPFILGADKLDFDGNFMSLGGGVSYFVSRWVALEASLLWTRFEADNSDYFYINTTTEDTSLRLGISTFF